MSNEYSFSVVKDPSLPSDRVVEVARAQRRLLFSILISLVGNVLLRSHLLGAVPLLVLAIMIAALTIMSVVALCRALGTNAFGWCLAMFLPLVNFICLLVLNARATRLLKANGLAVGLMARRSNAGAIFGSFLLGAPPLSRLRFVQGSAPYHPGLVRPRAPRMPGARQHKKARRARPTLNRGATKCTNPPSEAPGFARWFSSRPGNHPANRGSLPGDGEGWCFM